MYVCGRSILLLSIVIQMKASPKDSGLNFIKCWTRQTTSTVCQILAHRYKDISSSSPASSARVWLVKSLTSEMIASDTFSGVEMTSPSSVDTTDFSLTINFSAPIKSNYHYYIRDFQTATFFNNPFFFKSIIWSLVIWGSGVVQEAAG